MFRKRMINNALVCGFMLFLLFMFWITPAAAIGAIALFFFLNIIIEWEEECDRRNLDAYNRKIKY